jgi:hypothetical protein
VCFKLCGRHQRLDCAGWGRDGSFSVAITEGQSDYLAREIIALRLEFSPFAGPTLKATIKTMPLIVRRRAITRRAGKVLATDIDDSARTATWLGRVLVPPDDSSAPLPA